MIHLSRYGETVRFHFLRMVALNEEGEAIERSFEDFDAVVVYHEIDHPDGVLFIDRSKGIENSAAWTGFWSWSTRLLAILDRVADEEAGRCLRSRLTERDIALVAAIRERKEIAMVWLRGERLPTKIGEVEAGAVVPVLEAAEQAYALSVTQWSSFWCSRSGLDWRHLADQEGTQLRTSGEGPSQSPAS
jgi:hypothetical protein